MSKEDWAGSVYPALKKALLRSPEAALPLLAGLLSHIKVHTAYQGFMPIVYSSPSLGGAIG